MGKNYLANMVPATSAGLNAWAHSAVARGSQEHRGPMLIYMYMYVVYGMLFNVKTLI
jgi:hypothetical protein